MVAMLAAGVGGQLGIVLNGCRLCGPCGLSPCACVDEMVKTLAVVWTRCSKPLNLCGSDGQNACDCLDHMVKTLALVWTRWSKPLRLCGPDGQNPCGCVEQMAKKHPTRDSANMTAGLQACARTRLPPHPHTSTPAAARPRTPPRAAAPCFGFL
eukprot:358517-Chlamydomonas_euryale.AAC.3